VDLFADIGKSLNGYIVPGVICEEIGLVNKKEATYEKKAEKFLEFIRRSDE
jgi:hypothetical protein